jgi:hypothetical protein
VVTVTTSDPAAHAILQLKAEVVPVIDVTPSEAPEVRSAVGEPKTTTLTLSATDEKPFDVVAVQADPALRVSVRSAGKAGPTKKSTRAVAAGSNRYLVTLTPTEQARVGRSAAVVTLTTNKPKAESVSLRPVVVLAGRVKVVPPDLVFEPGPENTVMHAKISTRGVSRVKILGVESSDPDFTASTSTVAAGREYDLAVRYTGKPGRGLLHSQVTVRTNEPRQETIVIRVLGRT